MQKPERQVKSNYDAVIRILYQKAHELAARAFIGET